MEQRVRSADPGGERRPAAAQQLGGETFLPQIHLLRQRMVRNYLNVLKFMTKLVLLPGEKRRFERCGLMEEAEMLL